MTLTNFYVGKGRKIQKCTGCGQHVGAYGYLADNHILCVDCVKIARKKADAIFVREIRALVERGNA